MKMKYFDIRFDSVHCENVAELKLDLTDTRNIYHTGSLWLTTINILMMLLTYIVPGAGATLTLATEFR